MSCYIILYYIILYCTVLYSTVLYCIVLYYIILYHIISYRMIYYIILYYIILYYIIAIINVNSENGKYILPKHVGVLNNNKNQNIVQPVGGAICTGPVHGPVHGLHTTSSTLPNVIYERLSFTLAKRLHEILRFTSGADIIPYRYCR